MTDMSEFRRDVNNLGPKRVKILHSVIGLKEKTRMIVDSSTGVAIGSEVTRQKARLCACELRNENEADGVSSPSGAQDSLRFWMCVTLVYKLKVEGKDARKAYCLGKRSPDDPVLYLYLPSMYAALGKPMVTDNGDPILIKVTGNLYGTRRAGAIFWEFKRAFLDVLGFMQSVVEP